LPVADSDQPNSPYDADGTESSSESCLNTPDQDTGEMGSSNSGEPVVPTSDRLTSDQLTGDHETGEQETDDQETGDQETGEQETGDQETGDQETGDQVTWEQLTRVQSPLLHWFVLGISGSVLVMSALLAMPDMRTVAVGGVPLPEICTVKRLTGVPCPGCGMTRSFICISQGEWVRAWRLNPASFLMYFLIAAQIPYRLWQLWRVYRGQLPVAEGWFGYYFMAIAAAMFLQWVFKILTGTTLV